MLSRKTLGAVGLSITLSLASGAFAGQPGAGKDTSAGRSDRPPATQFTGRREYNLERGPSLERELIAYRFRKLSVKYNARIDLANRLSLLIDKGDCDGAARAALAAHDDLMAVMVPKACEAKQRGLI